MIGCYAHFIGALLLIYPHWTNQVPSWSEQVVKEGLLKEKPGCKYISTCTFGTTFIYSISLFDELVVTPALINSSLLSVFGSKSKVTDYVCEKLLPEEKQQLCEDAMRLFVAHEKYITAKPGKLWNDNSRNIRIDSFLNKKSSLPVPKLANEDPQYPCKKIRIEEMGLEKNMFWCMNRVVKVWNSNETDQIEGFFMSGGRARDTYDTIYMFKPSLTNDEEVIPWGQLTEVDKLHAIHERELGLWRSK